MDDFERDFTIEELLPSRSRPRLKKALQQMGLRHFLLIDLYDNQLIAHDPIEGLMKIPLAHELEPIAYLLFESDKIERAESAANFIIELLQTNWRYQMASDIHLQVSREDFEALQEKHKLLQASELKYKELSENLENRVQHQLTVIEESQRQLYEAEKMASIGQLAAGVAHEINNPIGFITSNLNAATEYLEDITELIATLVKQDATKQTSLLESRETKALFEDFGDLLLESIEGAKRVATIVADLKAFSNVDQSEESYIDLSQNIEQVARVFLTSVDKGVALNVNSQPLTKTWCKPAHINQLLLNLLHNAANAINPTDTITLSCIMLDEKIKLSVIDTGKGMSEETLRKAFDPFYTTHDVGSGTGLGLTASRDIVNAHHGEINVKSRLGEGTSIEILIPVKSNGSQL